MLTERGGESAHLHDALADSFQGRGRVVLVTGGPGTGKSVLVRAFAEEVDRRDTLLLTAVGSRTERTLELGVVSQLLRAAPLDPGILARILDAVDGLQVSLDSDAALPARVVNELSTLLLSLVERRPVVIVVDDLHHADNASRQILLHLRRRARAARLLFVFTEWERPSLTRHAELSLQPDRRVGVGPLSPAGVAELLSAGLGSAAGARFAPACFARTGGNPLLANAFLDDQTGRGPYLVSDAAAEPVVGPAFRQAVRECLGLWEPELVEVAGGLAVLGTLASPALLSDLLGMPLPAVRQTLDTLGAAGLVNDDRLRHPDLVTTLLESLPPADTATLHAGAAELLYRRGMAAVEVARHLTAVGLTPGEWAVAPLRQAAEQSVDDVPFAVRCLELALVASEDERNQVELRAALVRVAWRMNPSASARHLTVLRGALDEGELTWRDAVPMVRYLLWQGDLAGAGGQMRAVRAAAGAPDVRTAAELRLATEWSVGRLREGDPDGVRAALATSDRADAAANSWQRTGTLLESWTSGAGKETVRAAEHILQSCLGDVFPEVAMIAILALDHTDRQDRVRYWCDVLGEQALARGAVTWQAMLGWVRADIAWRRGELIAAEREASAALELLHPQSWGVLIGLPLSTLILANSAMGHDDVVAELLARPVPDEMFRTVFGVRYLHAAGQHSLAGGRTLAALDAFEACASWMRGRDSGIPPMVPWRSSLAQAYLMLGRRREARDLVTKQLNRCAGGGMRLRAISLRVLAACVDISQRVPLLRDAILLLERCDDRLELARTQADLSEVYRELGQLSTARLVLRKAEQTAKACAAGELSATLARSTDHRSDEPAEDGEGMALLSDAERKVAELAAHGHTNREIGRRLYITVSTVEQHLTRVYRKLNVSKRTDLPTRLARLEDPRVVAVAASR
jgi:DNA-binding CsgD family transcriptional regulator